MSKSLLQSLTTGLLAIEQFSADGVHTARCECDGEGTPCSCGFVEPRDVASALLEQVAALPPPGALAELLKERDAAIKLIRCVVDGTWQLQYTAQVVEVFARFLADVDKRAALAASPAVERSTTEKGNADVDR